MIQTCLGLRADVLEPLLNKHLSPAKRWEVICLPTLTPSPSDLWGFRHLPSNLEWALYKLSLDLTVTDSPKLWVWESQNRPTAQGTVPSRPVSCKQTVWSTAQGCAQYVGWHGRLDTECPELRTVDSYVQRHGQPTSCVQWGGRMWGMYGFKSGTTGPVHLTQLCEPR